MNINNLSDYGGKMFKENDDKPYTGRVFDLYRSTGEKKLEGNFRNGIKNGKWTYYTKVGNCKYEINYKAGIYTVAVFTDNLDIKYKGQPITDENEQDGTYLYRREDKYDFSKLPEAFITIKNGKPNGLIIEWHDNGQKRREGKVKNRMIDGLWTYWNENGVVDSSGTYRDDKKEGKWMIWHNSDTKKEEQHYNNGIKNGLFTEWHENGKIKSIGNYKDGVRDGNWEFWLDVGWDDEFSTFKTMAGKYKDGTAINWEITIDPEKNILEKFDLTVTSNETKGFVKSNSGELIIDDSWVRIKVYAQQFCWNIHYPGQDGKFGETNKYLIDASENPIGLDRNSKYGADDIYTINQLRLPVNTNILLEVTTLAEYHGYPIEDLSKYKDIMDELYHILLIPELNLLQEARINIWKNIKINVKETGNYMMRCVHYCGIGAYRHKGFVTIHEKESYQDWLFEQAEYLEEETGDGWGNDDDW